MTDEVERLKEQVNLWQEEASSVGCENEWLKACLKEKNAEIEKLERAVSHLEDYCNSIPDKVKAEAIKEFVGELIEKYSLELQEYDGDVVFVYDINDFVKEKVGESNV